MKAEVDPVLKHARTEGMIIGLLWFVCTTYCCGYSYLYGYNQPDRKLGVEDIDALFGIPSWFFWGVLIPWGFCTLFTFWFAGFYMADDDLGFDHTVELEDDIREAGHAD